MVPLADRVNERQNTILALYDQTVSEDELTVQNPVVRLLSVFVITSFVSGSVWASDSPTIVADVVYGHKDGLAMTFDVFKPSGRANRAGVLFMVSGGWRSVWAPPEAAVARFAPLLDKGFTVFSVRHGSSPKYLIPEIVEDVRRSVRFIRAHANDYGIDPDRLGVFGGSAGGHLSLMLGTASDSGRADARDPILRSGTRIAAVVAYFPPTDLRNLVPKPPATNERFPALNFDPDKAADYSPIVHVSPDDPPTLLVHGDKDALVPLSNSENILREFKDKNVASELVVIAGAGHGFRGADNDRATEAMVEWFVRHLDKK